jgi:nitrile hydratase
MNGVHDLGGMHGFGPIPYEKDEPVFHEPWEGRFYGLRRSLGTTLFASTDGFRASLERMEPARYLALSYYERWLAVTEEALLQKGLVTADELRARYDLYREQPDAPVPRKEDPERAAQVAASIYRRSSLHREGPPPRFAVGDRVVARNMHPRGHTRLPRYVRGRRGVIARLHGTHDFPDTLAAGRGPHPQAVYSVRFEAMELWGESAEPNACVYLDLWDSYLEFP